MTVVLCILAYLVMFYVCSLLYGISNLPIDHTTSLFIAALWPITLPLSILFFLMRWSKGCYRFVKENLITIYNLYKELFKDIQ